MLGTKIRTTMTALAVAGAMSIAGAGIASAAAPTGSKHGTTTPVRSAHHKRAKHAIHRGSRVHVFAPGHGTARVSAGATGDGPADQAACDRYASAINSWLDASVQASDIDEAIHDGETATHIEDDAMNQGCFIVH